MQSPMQLAWTEAQERFDDAEQFASQRLWLCSLYYAYGWHVPVITDERELAEAHLALETLIQQRRQA